MANNQPNQKFLMNATWQEVQSSAGAAFASAGAADVAAYDGVALHYGNAREEYVALTSAVGMADFGQRTQVELTGADRQTFLHNLCTNEVRRLTPGTGCEAFLCNAQGHILALVNIFCCGLIALLSKPCPARDPLFLRISTGISFARKWN